MLSPLCQALDELVHWAPGYRTRRGTPARDTLASVPCHPRACHRHQPCGWFRCHKPVSGSVSGARLPAVLRLVKTAAMTPPELRSRIWRSGVSRASWSAAAECDGLVGWCASHSCAPCSRDHSVDRQSAAADRAGVASACGYAGGAIEGMGSKVSRQRRASGWST